MFEPNEPIKVLALFSHGKLTPRRFCWQGRFYQIDKVNGAYKSREGLFPIYSFSVQSNGNIYEIIFKPEKMVWKLTRVYQNDQ
ncbi:MAG: hypothetical protein C4562_02730 [Actinobacteria bacterium]|nr:MAG: hypothetical protein C4562_02730 [Actinomycetota bacterium]